MIEFYPGIKLVHVAAIVSSGTLFALRGASVGDDEPQRLLKHIGQLASDVTAVDVAFVLNLGADKGDGLDYEGG